MAEQWIIRVQERDYGPADLATLREWKSEGRVLPNNPARSIGSDDWETAANIPGLFEAARPPVQKEVTSERSQVRDPRTEDRGQTTELKPPRRNVLIDTFRIYFRGFFQYFGLALLGIVPTLCAEFTGRFINAAPGVNVDLRTLVAATFGLCMLALRIVLIPVYIAGIQILTAELATGERISFLSVLNGAVKYWPRVAGLGLFVYGVFFLLTVFGLGVVLMMLSATVSGSLFSIVLALGLTILQIWLFCRFFINVLFWQQFVVLENLNVYEALRESRALARGGQNLRWYQRPVWRGALIFSVWTVVVIAIMGVALWPKIGAQWDFVLQAVDQLKDAQDPQLVWQKLTASLPKEQGASVYELGFTVLQRILEPLLGIAFVVLYLDSKPDSE